ncbi:hypothetical protein ACIRST_41885 [Kitasatospora sp. NPDC101447]|uniref:hypothetical protein n=1 Tax=Kitasatospora sp. NPDC101447 TaxID=3364102 RepID=UPI0038164636
MSPRDGLRALRQAWAALPPLEKVRVVTDPAVAVGTVLALVVASISLFVSTDASDKAYTNQRLANRLATAYRVAWYVDGQSDGPRQLIIENRSLIPAYQILLVDARSSTFYRTAALGACVRYSVEVSDGAEFSDFTMYFQTAGQWYRIDTARRTEPTGGGRQPEAAFAAVKGRTDAAATSGRKPKLQEVQGCG